MKVVIDIEANSLRRPSNIWVIVCHDIDTGKKHIFREVTTNDEQRRAFLTFADTVELWIGHNILGYDLPVIADLLGYTPASVDANHVIDTLTISKMAEYSRTAHSIEQYGIEFGIPKVSFNNFKEYSIELEEYCIRDVDINILVYRKYLSIINDPKWYNSISLEQEFQLIVNNLHNNGFSINHSKLTKILNTVTEQLEVYDVEMHREFPPRSKLIREVLPRLTKHGTISRSSIPRALGTDLSVFSEDAPFSYISFDEFNPASHKQLIDVLTEAGWKPKDKTKTHIETERQLQRLKHTRNRSQELDELKLKCENDLIKLGKYGWKINETNLDTLPETAPSPARLLAKRILLEARRRTLTEWDGLIEEDGRIHGTFQGIGAWTHRMAHQKPNTANIPNEFDTAGNKKLLGKEMRSLWQAPKNRLLVGVDAEGIQLRIFAHYIEDEEFTDALVRGRKEDKTDPHSLNQRILGSVCKSRAAAKRFIYALLLGAGLGKLAEILECSIEEVEEALSRLLVRYSGWKKLREEVFPRDARRGYFYGLDGRRVAIPGETESNRRHLCMSGYLQNGEAVCMKKATLLWFRQLMEEHHDDNSIHLPDDLVLCLYSGNSYLSALPWKIVNFVHDEWQTECKNNVKLAMHIAEVQATSLRIVGEQLGLKCPLAGSYWNDDLKDYTIGTNWAVTH